MNVLTDNASWAESAAAHTPAAPGGGVVFAGGGLEGGVAADGAVADGGATGAVSSAAAGAAVDGAAAELVDAPTLAGAVAAEGVVVANDIAADGDAAPTIRLYGTVDDSIVDGPGLRFSIFVQGCGRGCPGCHNPESQPYDAGQQTSVEQLLGQIAANPLLTGVTLSGGEPFDQAAALLPLVRQLRAERPRLNIWAYSGYRFEELCAGQPQPAAELLLALVDVLVDGPFIAEQRSLELRWKGSANQRIIDVPASLAAGQPISWE